MDSEITRATIVNWALIELAHPANFSIDVESELGGIVHSVWQRVVDQTFALHDWTFCRRTRKLPRKDEQPETGYRFAFILPDDRIGDPLKISTDPQNIRPLREYTIEGEELHANEPDIWVRVRVEVDPKRWDPAFRAAFVTALASTLAVPLMHDASAAAELHGKAFGSPSQGGAGGEFGRLIAQNLASEPKGSPFEGYDPLVDARFM